jgi:ABC-2 type transport system permease protein
MVTRILSLIRKEFLHILRDPRTLFVMLAMPIIQLTPLGYAATTDVEQLRTAILDGDKSLASRKLVDAYRASNYFDGGG